MPVLDNMADELARSAKRRKQSNPQRKTKGKQIHDFECLLGFLKLQYLNYGRYMRRDDAGLA